VYRFSSLMFEGSFPKWGKKTSPLCFLRGEADKTPRFHPAYGSKAVARDRCNGRARPGPPGRLGSGTAGAVRRNLPPKRSPLCAPPSGFVSVHANFLSVTIAPARAACQGGIAGKAVLFAEAVSSAGGAGAVETTKNIRLKLCNQPNLFPPGQPSLDFPRR